MKKYPILSAHFQCNEEKIVFNSLFRNFCQFDLTKERTNFTKLEQKNKSCKIKFSKLSKNDSLALVNNDASVDIYCLKSMTKISHIASSHSISDVIFDNLSQSLISVSDETDRINIWDIRNQKIRSQLVDITSHSNTSLGISPKEKLLCVGNSKGPVSAYSLKESINILQTGTITPTKVFSNLKTVCNGLRFSNKTNLMVSYSSNANNSIKLVFLVIKQYQSIYFILTIKINCSAKLVYSNFLVNEESRCSAAAFSPNGTVLYLGMTTGAVRPYSFTDLQ
ncbi:MAG: U3 snoRNP protein, variant 2 [Marteilia pararefringens]